MARSTKTLLLNPKFQIKLLSYFLALSLATITIFYGSVMYFFVKFHEVGLELGLPNGHVFFRFLADQKDMMNKIFIVTSLFSSILLVFGGLVLSHKIAGPVYRLCRYLERAKDEDDMEDLTFRENDFFTEIPGYVNAVMKKMKAKKPNSDKDKAA